MEFELNRPIEKEDIDYFFGARLGIIMDARTGKTRVFSEDNDYLTKAQIESLYDRGYYPQPIEHNWLDNPDNWQVKRKSPDKEELKILPKKQLEQELDLIQLIQGEAQIALNIIKRYNLEERVDPIIFCAMISGYSGLIKQLTKESHKYMDAIAFNKPLEEKE